MVGIDLQLARSGAIIGATPTFNVSLFDGDAAAEAYPAALLTRTYALSDAPLGYETQKGVLFRFDTSVAGYKVKPGRVFTVRIDVEPAYNTGGFGIINGVRVNGVSNYLTYSAGAATIYYLGGVKQQAGFDRGFRTLVDTSTVPEPSLWAMTILGFAHMSVALRRKRLRTA